MNKLNQDYQKVNGDGNRVRQLIKKSSPTYVEISPSTLEKLNSDSNASEETTEIDENENIENAKKFKGPL